MSTLYDIYKQQGQALPNTVAARFADPKFAQAAQQAGITQDQYKINAGNAGYNTQIANLYGKTPATTPTAVTAPPVVNSSPAVANPLPIAPVDSNMNDVYGNYDSYLTNPTGYLQSKGVSEANSRSQALAAMQTQIDGTNSFYAEQLRQAQLKGQGHIGSMGAIQARRGLLGSDMGDAQMATVTQDNQNIYDSINNEKKLKVQELMSKAETSGTQRFQDERTAIEGGLKSRIDFLKSSEERKKTKTNEAAMALMASGYSTKDMTPEQKANYAKGYGITGNALDDAFNMINYKKTQEEVKRQNDINDALAKKGIQNVPSGSQGYAHNTKTNKYELIANNPKVAAPIRGSTGPGANTSVTDYTNKADITELSSTAQSYLNAITRGDTTLTEALTKIGASKVGLALKNEIMLGLDSLTGGKEGSQLITGPDVVNFRALLKNAQKINTSQYGQFDTPGGFLSHTFNPTSSAYIGNLLDNLSLEKRDLLKGSGAISDFESRMLANSVSILKNKNISEEAAATALEEITALLSKKINQYDVQINTNKSQTVPNIITAPDGQRIQITD